MKRFSYEARDKTTGKIVKSEVQAETEHAAGRLLMEQGFIPVKDLKEINEEGFFGKFTNRISSKDKIVFTRQFSTLISAGLPLSQSLHTVGGQTQNKKMKNVIEDIMASVEAGTTLSDAFSKHSDVFDKVYLSLVAAGELSGTLDESLLRIAAQQEKDSEMMSKIKGALTYPIIVLFVILGVVGFMMFTVVPQVEQLYRDMGKELPLMTQIMVNASNFIMNYWWVVIIAIATVVWFFLQFLKTDTGIKSAAAFKLNVPMFGALFRKLYMARFTRTGQTLLATGVAMLDMLNICGDALNNVIVKKSIDEAAEMVQGGKNLSDSLRGKGYILPLVPQMISIGEQSGKIDQMLGKTAQVYENELEEQIRSISTMIEPIMMVVMAVLAGGMIGAILMPIYGLVNNV